MNKKIPMRKCVGCQEMKPKKELIRIFHQETGEISIDLTGKKNGRGAYICANENCLQLAQKNKGLSRSLKVEIPADIFDELQGEMRKLETR